MKDSRKSIKVVTIAAAVSIFGIGTAFAVQAAGSSNSADVKVVNSQAAAKTVEVEKNTHKEAATQAEKPTSAIQESETQTESDAQPAEAGTETASSNTQDNTQNQPAEQPAQTDNSGDSQPAASNEPQDTPQAPVLEMSEDDINNAQAQGNASAYASYINQVYELINQERAAAGTGAVGYDSTLTVMACHRALENANANSMKVEGGRHIRPNGQKASTICSYYGQYGSFGENLGRYQNTPDEIITGWHNSSAHYSCMTNAKYTRVGVGVAQDSNGNYYWAAIFMN
ncbi:MAG: CAP domain-containing protein [Eubacteriales bacterium]|nr:CAP domain-containing protein [Eubacteriales bacterium]